MTKLNVIIVSDYTSDPKEEVWPTDNSFNVAPNFSDPISDNMSGKYQTKAITRATGAIGEYFYESDGQTHTSKWLEVILRNLTPSEVDDSRPWPNSNRTKDN